jgi:hypothetical protein
MHVPCARERVFVARRSEVFLVVWVDHERQEADLIPLHGAVSVEESVPFSQLEPYRENAPLESK